MVQTIDWAQREQVLHSFELLARYVMPQFQGTAISTAASNQWAYEHQEVLSAGRVQAIDRAGVRSGNRGWDAAANAIEMADLLAGLGH